MWKNWNSVGRIKAIIILISVFLNLFGPPSPEGMSDLYASLGVFAFGMIGIPLLVWVNALLFGQSLAKPHWNENPVTFRRPPVMFHFASVLFIFTGASLIIGSGLRMQELNGLGMMVLFMGFGTYVGVFMVHKLNRAK